MAPTDRRNQGESLALKPIVRLEILLENLRMVGGWNWLRLITGGELWC